MATTFDPALPAALDRIRFYVGDVGTVEGKFAFIVTDELVAGVFGIQAGTTTRDELLAAADIADELGAQFARQADTKNLSLSVSASQRSKAFKDCAKRLRGRAGVSVAPNGAVSAVAEMFVGGLTISGKKSLREDIDAIQPAFRRGQDDHPGTKSTEHLHHEGTD